jgi:3-oxoacyl-[acyl-carrier-protein] synthase-3
MDGMEVFNFTLRVVPKGVKTMLGFLKKQPSDIDYLILHQANKFMTDFLAKKLKVNASQVPYCLDRYGNTSSASIPLTIVSELEGKLKEPKHCILCGFGAGLSWGTTAIIFKNCRISHLLEYQDKETSAEVDE